MTAAAPLHLYLIRRRGAGPGGCKAYVACAADETRAVEMCPRGGAATPDIAVEHLGIALNGAAPGVVLANHDAV
jgi:hypothetical protein